jgi:hypothetical protein
MHLVARGDSVYDHPSGDLRQAQNESSPSTTACTGGEQEAASLSARSIEESIQATLERLLQPVVEKVAKKLEMPPQEWFSIKETAALTGLSVDHVRRHVTAGLLPVTNPGHLREALLPHPPEGHRRLDDETAGGPAARPPQEEEGRARSRL